MEEIWKDLEGFDYHYQVSNLGRVRNVDSGNVFKLSFTSNRYLRVMLKIGGRFKSFRVHRLVAQAFVQNPNNYNEVNHINHIRHDNRAENLEWINHIQNMKGCQNGGRKRNNCGKKVALFIGNKKIKEYRNITLASADTHISSKVISYLVNPKNKKFKWKLI